jgi:uncharacterized membrane protein
MKTVFAVVVVGVTSLALFGFGAQDTEKKKEAINFEKEIVPIVKANCLGCHNKDSNKGGVIFPDKMTEEDAVKNPRLWRKSGREVRSGHMPPKDHGSMGDKDREKFVAWVNAKFPRRASN